MRIPKRLLRLYDLAEGDELWDIGCDHSLLAQFNFKEKKFSLVHCVDKSKASLEKITASAPLECNKHIELILSDGCDLNWNQVSGSVVIAGVGGNTVLKIVESCPPKRRKQLVWILNPFTSVDKFSKEIINLLPGSALQIFDTVEAGRTRTIFKWRAEVVV